MEAWTADPLEWVELMFEIWISAWSDLRDCSPQSGKSGHPKEERGFAPVSERDVTNV